jgi:hypothetical protein
MIPKLNLSETKVADSLVPEAKGSNRASFKRKGHTYIINNTGSNEDLQETYEVIDGMYDEAVSMARCADLKAYFCKMSYIFSSIFICIAGAIIGSLSASNYTFIISNSSNCVNMSPGVLYTLAVLGFLITIVKTLISIFNIEQRGVILKEISIKLRKVARNIKKLKTLQIPIDLLYNKIDQLQTDMDELDISLFGDVNSNITSKVILTNKNDVKIDMKPRDIEDPATKEQNSI